MKFKLLLFLLFISGCVSAQKFSLNGKLVDSLNNPLPAATVMLLNHADSSLVSFAVTNQSGQFALQNITRKEYLFRATYVGLKNYVQKIWPFGDARDIDLGTIMMQPLSTELAAVEISAERAPVVIKHDTIEFNAGSFRTAPNAMVEDLLKKLPGVEIDADGSITAQGEQVRNVTVDGKTFFGSDPKLATRNLPADAIDKVQVFDKKSDQALFSGIDDGQREKTINLELKPEKRRGAFGTLAAGAGTDSRFSAKTNINRFTKERQMSVLAMGNNVNEPGFSMEEYMNFTGGSQRMMAGGQLRMKIMADNESGVPLNFGNQANGIMETYAAGVNMNSKFGSKGDVNASYFMNFLDHARNTVLNRENFLPGRNFIFAESSNEINRNLNHRGNLMLDQKIDSSNSLKVTTSFSYNETDSDNAVSSSNSNSENVVQNESNRLSLMYGTTKTWNGTLLWRHRFARKGRTFSTNFQLGTTSRDREGSLHAVNSFRVPDDSLTELQQNNHQRAEYKYYGTTLSYTEPLGKRRYLEVNYGYRLNANNSDRSVYDISNGESIFNGLLSNAYNSNYQYHRAGFHLRITRTNYNLLVGSSLQQAHLQGLTQLTSNQVDRVFNNILPVLRFNYDFSNTKHLQFDYETSVQEPEIEQLQPVIDNSDPLNLYKGNPQLRPAYEQSWRINYVSFNPLSFMNMFFFTDLDYTMNAITSSQTIDENFVRTITPVNIERQIRLRSDGNLGLPLGNKGSRINIGAKYEMQSSITLLNDVPNKVYQQTAGGSVGYTYRYMEMFDLNLSTEADGQKTKYEFDQADQLFMNFVYRAEANVTFLKNYHLNSALNILDYRNKQTAFHKTIPLLNVAVSRFLLKNKSGEIKLSANNLLNKALGVNQTATANYLQQETTNSLGRYFFVTFIYSLNKKLNPMAIPKNGMMRIRR